MHMVGGSLGLNESRRAENHAEEETQEQLWRHPQHAGAPAPQQDQDGPPLPRPYAGLSLNGHPLGREDSRSHSVTPCVRLGGSRRTGPKEIRGTRNENALRAVLRPGGRLVFCGAPPILPLVGQGKAPVCPDCRQMLIHPPGARRAGWCPFKGKVPFFYPGSGTVSSENNGSFPNLSQ